MIEKPIDEYGDLGVVEDDKNFYTKDSEKMRNYALDLQQRYDRINRKALWQVLRYM